MRHAIFALGCTLGVLLGLLLTFLLFALADGYWTFSDEARKCARQDKTGYICKSEEG